MLLIVQHIYIYKHTLERRVVIARIKNAIDFRRTARANAWHTRALSVLTINLHVPNI